MHYQLKNQAGTIDGICPAYTAGKWKCTLATCVTRRYQVGGEYPLTWVAKFCQESKPGLK